MAQSVAAPHKRGFLSTLRTDAWWFEPVLVAISLSIFFGWLTISIFLDTVGHYEIGPYITPVFEPLLFDASSNIFLSPGMIVLLGPVPFRATCYYYRRAYYRAYLMSPPACAVGDVGKTYKGESIFPFILQNLHRFTMYVALLFVPILWYGAIYHGFYNHEELGPDGQTLSTGFGIGVGSILLVLNAFLLMMYTFSCHSLRHFVGGSLNMFSKNGTTRFRKKIYDKVTLFNTRHRFWAWTSLLVIVATDVYIRLVASGKITDLNTWSGF